MIQNQRSQLHDLCWAASLMAEATRLEGYLDLDLHRINAAATRDKQSVSLNMVVTRVRTRNFVEIRV